MTTLKKWMFGALMMGLLFASSASAVMITGDFTALWYDESEPGQGFLIHVVDTEGTPNLLVYWFSFDSEGNQIWLVSQEPIEGDTDTVTLEMLIVTGGYLTFGDFDPSQIMTEVWGELTISFADCDNGTVTFTANDPAIGSGEFDITRLTNTVGDDCTGGPIDNMPGNASAQNIKVDFQNTGVDADARGMVKYEMNPNFIKLKVFGMKLDPRSSYEVLVNGEAVAELSTNPGGNGRQFFRSPRCTNNWLPMDFEPLDATVEIARDGEVYLTTVIDSSLLEDGEGDSDADGDGEDDDGDDGDDGQCSADDGS